MKFNTYTVNWAVDIKAKTPREAAQKALEIMRDKESAAQTFHVVNHGLEGAKWVDLLDDEESEDGRQTWPKEEQDAD